MTKSARAGKQARWLDLIERWQRSRLSVREFCRRHQLSEPSFYSWRRVLRERGLLDEPTAGAQAQTPAFVKLTLPVQAAPSSAIEVVLGRRVLRVPAGFDADALLHLVRLLEDASC